MGGEKKMGGVGCFVYDGESEAEDEIIHQHPLKWHSGRTGFNIII